MIEIIRFPPGSTREAAALFAAHFEALRAANPLLPGTFSSTDHVAERLGDLMAACGGLLALDRHQIAGYVGWYIVDNFRETGRRAAYVPEWAHLAPDRKVPVYRQLYRAAASQWADQGCRTHALSVLGHDASALDAWFRSGFGLAVLDGVRSLDLLNQPAPAGITVRRAGAGDIADLVRLEAEHWRHYTQPPVFMCVAPAPDAAALSEFLADPAQGYWVAADGDQVVGFMRFEGRSGGAADVVHDASTAAITGAYVLPAYRGRRVAAALLNGILADAAAQGCERCAVDFESFNPEAADFWTRHFTIVCYSVMRILETQG